MKLFDKACLWSGTTIRVALLSTIDVVCTAIGWEIPFPGQQKQRFPYPPFHSVSQLRVKEGASVCVTGEINREGD